MVASHPLPQTMELPDGLTEPNAGAYTKTETREGPPLDYVAEKLRTSLEVLHTLYHAAERALPHDLPVPKRFQTAEDVLRRQALQRLEPVRVRVPTRPDGLLGSEQPLGDRQRPGGGSGV
jgi:hypothetical protein